MSDVTHGTTIGQYRILRKLGEGGMGAVYLAEHTLIGRLAAIKVLLPGSSSQREIVDRFFNEARAAIPDPGIVQVFDYGVHHDGRAYIVMEYLEGEPLEARVQRMGRLSSRDALRIVRQAAGSLAVAHQHGVIHRDLKPENIFLVRDEEAQGGERPKILDFGIAKLSGNNVGPKQTRTGAVIGTPAYMSPEQCRGAGLVDHRTDIYSLGCVLFHMVTGRLLFEAEGAGELISAHLGEAPRAPSSLVQGSLPDGVDQLVLRCLAKPLEQRFQTMRDLQRAADSLIARITATSVPTSTVPGETLLSPGFRSEYPGAPSLSSPGQPTTLGSAAAESGAVPSARRRSVLIAFVALLGVSGGIAALAIGGASRSGPAREPTASDRPQQAIGSDAGNGEATANMTADKAPDAGVAGVITDAGTVALASSDAGEGMAVPKPGGTNVDITPATAMKAGKAKAGKAKAGKAKAGSPNTEARNNARSTEENLYDDR